MPIVDFWKMCYNIINLLIFKCFVLDFPEVCKFGLYNIYYKKGFKIMGMLDELKKDLSGAAGKAAVSDQPKSDMAAAVEAGIAPSLFSALGSLYVNMVAGFSDLDLDIVKANDELILNGLRPDERYVPYAVADYLSANFAFILSMLISDYNNFRDFVFGGIDNEVSIDKLSDSDRAAARAKMNKKTVFVREHGMEIGITNFSNNICATLRKVADAGFAKLTKTKAEEECNASLDKQTDDDRKVLGVIFSEYIYFVRAFANNAEFAAEFLDRVNAYKKAYGIS